MQCFFNFFLFWGGLGGGGGGGEGGVVRRFVMKNQIYPFLSLLCYVFAYYISTKFNPTLAREFWIAGLMPCQPLNAKMRLDMGQGLAAIRDVACRHE